MFGFPILVKADRILEKQSSEFVIAHPADPLRLSDAGLFHRAADRASGGSIELSWGSWTQPIGLTAAQRRQDAGAGGVICFSGGIAQTDSKASTPLKPAIQVRT